MPVTTLSVVGAVAALSTQLSTAALDKNPQSRERGITLDLGFSSFVVPLPEHLHGRLPCRHAAHAPHEACKRSVAGLLWLVAGSSGCMLSMLCPAIGHATL